MKICTRCGVEKPSDAFLRYGTKIMQSDCKPCRNAEVNRLKAVRIEREKELAKMEAERLIEMRKQENVALPRTFSHLKSKDSWTGHTDRYYVRNEGNKHIPSKGTAG